MARKHKNKKIIKKGRSNPLLGMLMRLFEKNPAYTYNAKQAMRKLNIKGKKRLEAVLEAALELEQKGKLVQVQAGVFKLARHSGASVVGVVQYVNPRFGFIITDEMEQDIKVTSRNMNLAMDGDTVRVSVVPSRRDNPEGQVIEVLKRSRNQFVGLLQKNKGFSFVVPDNKRMHKDIFISEKDGKKGFEGDKVIVQIKDWGSEDKNPTGIITKVLGEAGQHNVEMHAILAEFELPVQFPASVEEEANGISDKIEKKEIDKRRDMRKVTTFTIDPLDAKDFDDALSMQKLENGNWEIGVHIADVTHYVKEESILEEEAFERATSVYLVDRVVPMLPERLSNGLCSLRPNEDKLTFSAVFELDENAGIKSQWFGRTVIHSDRRFTYEEAQERIESKEGEFADEINTLNELALLLRKRRFNEGSISFETAEVRFKLDKDGTPLEVIPKIRVDAHKLIEDFMLLANKKVAEFVFNQKENDKPKTMVYRTHDNPNMERLESFAGFALRFGHDVKIHEGNVAEILNELSEKIEGKPEENVLQSLAIRSMSKAIYTTEPKKHFGLGFAHYSHFTSPIRRYPDMMVHRLLQHYLDKGKSVNEDEWETKCSHSSDREKRAADAERASIKYKQVEFMQMQKEQVFDGIINGVTDFGFFVEIESTKCEGLVRISEIDNDYYVYDADSLTLTGERNKRRFSFGDKVQVEVKATNLQNRTIDLSLVD